MNQNDAKRASRREVLQSSLAAGVGMIFFAASARGAAGTPKKLAKEAVKYTDNGGERGKDCDDCSQYLPGKNPAEAPSCKIVEGPINAHGHCIAFSPRSKG